MGMTQLGEDPKGMTTVTTLPVEDRPETRRRLHLRDISNETMAGNGTIGAELRAARLRRGEDLRTIGQTLRIRREQLEALEEGRRDGLPGRAYAIGFIRSYAEYLGLDPAHVVERYKAEIDQEERANELVFPKISSETRLPRGMFFIAALVLAAGIYGVWLLTQSADRMIAQRVPPVPDRIEAQVGAAAAPDEKTIGASFEAAPGVAPLRGDTASASTRPSTARGATPSGVLAPSAVYEAPPVSAAAAAPELPADEAGGEAVQIAALEPAAEAPSAAEPPLPGLPPIAEGQAYGLENSDGRVVIRARKNDAWIRVEDAQGQVLIERTLRAGDSYKAPNRPGVILVARDASAFELLMDGVSLGLAGPPTLVLTGKPVDPAGLLAAMPQYGPGLNGPSAGAVSADAAGGGQAASEAGQNPVR
jgi:cytoskeleton protein RodZ